MRSVSHSRISKIGSLIVILRRHRRQTPAPLALATGVSPHQPPPGRDFSLKAGETLNIKIGGGSSTKKKATTTASTGTGFLLPPPPPPAPRNR